VVLSGVRWWFVMRRGGLPTTTAETGFPVRRPGPAGPLGGRVFIPAGQRERLLDAAEESIAESGFAAFRLHRVCKQAGMSHRTFYDLFADREECFLALFDRAVGELGEIARPAYEAHEEWSEGVRAVLSVVLEYLGERPGRARLVFVEALGAGPRVLSRRAEVLQSLTSVLDEGRPQHKDRGRGLHQSLPPFTAESVVGAVCSMIHTRVCEQTVAAGSPKARGGKGEGSHSATGFPGDLLNPLMATIVLPYRGHRAARRELVRQSELARSGVRRPSSPAGPAAKGPLVDLPMRLTYRTLAVLSAISEDPGASNHNVARAANIKDEGQASKLLARLARLRLVENAGPGYPSGAPNEWRLTERGEELLRTVSPLPWSTDRPRREGLMEAAA
jgi:AcrR family transcriptional regulator